MEGNFIKKYYLSIFVFFLLFIAIYLIYLDYRNFHKQFTFAMLDIGQGDAFFVESPGGTQVLIDAGPPKKIVSELSKIMSPFDKSIDAIFITNPDQDHIGGVLDILENYKVDAIFVSGTESDSKIYQNLKTLILKKEIPEIIVKRGMNIDFGGGVEFDILFPDRDVSKWPTNDGSIVGRLTYKNFSVLLTGDATIKTENIVVNNNDFLKSEILKVPHHGSRNSISEKFIEKVDPEVALISSGKSNKYGHPHKEVIDLFNNLGVNILRSDELGTILIKCDTMGVCTINK